MTQYIESLVPVDPNKAGSKPKFDYAKTDATQYKAQEGESLMMIANRYKVGLQQLRFYNRIESVNSKLRVGQIIHIPSAPVLVPAGA